MIHAVWGTKSRFPYLTGEIKPIVIDHIRANAREKNIFIDTIDGYVEHMHCLFGLNADMSVSKALQLVKGESAFWLNRQDLMPHKFEWADEYFASSVSESQLPKVRAYINNQEEHHKKVTFQQEYEAFVKSHGFDFQG